MWCTTQTTQQLTLSIRTHHITTVTDVHITQHKTNNFNFHSFTIIPSYSTLFYIIIHK